jgi:hypothetical protein
MRIRIPTLAFVLVLVFGAGCGGPRVHNTYGVKPIDTDVALGSASKPVPAAPVREVTDVAGFPTPFVPPPPPPAVVAAAGSPPAAPATTAAPRRVACPTARADVFPREPAAQDVVGKPAVGTYTYRAKGTVSRGGLSLPLPTSLTRSVRDVRDLPSVEGSQQVGYTLVTELPSGGSLTETYQTITGSTRGAQDGIYLVRSVYIASKGATPATFAPATPALLMQLPAESATSAQGWKTVATDPLSRTALELEGKVGPRVRVDACGTVVAAWEVHLSGRIVGDTTQQTIDEVLTVATQYGGLFVATVLDLSGTDGIVPVAEHAESIINGITPVSS